MSFSDSLRRTKIVATVGPAIATPDMLRAVIEAGATTLRLNFSHGTHDDHLQSIRLIRQLSYEMNQPVAILQDLQGPKIRLGKFADGSITLKKGDPFALTSQAIPGTKTSSMVTYAKLADEVSVGATILLDDGRVEMKVEAVDSESKTLHCRVVVGGKLSDSKGGEFPWGLFICQSTDRQRSRRSHVWLDPRRGLDRFEFCPQTRRCNRD